MRAVFLATIVAFFAAPGHAMSLAVVEEVCGSWAQFTYAVASAQAQVPPEVFKVEVEKVIEGEENEQTVRTMRQVVAFVAKNKEHPPLALAAAVYEECAVKLSKMEEI